MNPFLVNTPKPIVTLCGKRGGYLMIAPSMEITAYESLSPDVLQAALAWAARLEKMGSPRAYWMILSEVTRHLHVHIYPRWPDDKMRGVALFEARASDPQPGWNPELQQALLEWADEFNVEVIRT